MAAVLTVCGISLVAGTASAVALPTTSVSANSASYSITYFTGSHEDNIGKFTSTEIPWFGDATLASTFAVAIGTSLGTPNAAGYGAYRQSFATTPEQDLWGTLVEVRAILAASGNVIKTGVYTNESCSYAILAPSAPAPVPAPLPIFGATKRLLGLSRRLHRGTTQSS